MHIPSKKQWQTVIDKFKSILHRLPENHLDMRVAVVYRRKQQFLHECGTVHCVAGWYYLASKTDIELEAAKTRTSYIGFTSGVMIMREDLGFHTTAELEEFVRNNPEIWGNSHGQELFSDSIAYDNAETLHEVVTYLEGVRDRSPE